MGHRDQAWPFSPLCPDATPSSGWGSLSNPAGWVTLFFPISRLSDYLFVLARFAAKQEGKKEQIYRRMESQD